MLIPGKYKTSTICIFRILILTALTTFTSMAKDRFVPEKAEEYTGMARPLHTTKCAAVESMAEASRFFGKPSIGRVHANLGHGIKVLDVCDSFEDMDTVFKVRPDKPSSRLQNLDFRFLPVKEGNLKKDWLPAINPEIDFKYDRDIEDDKKMGYTHHETKIFGSLTRPIVVNLDLLSSDLALMKLPDFTRDRKVVPKGSVYSEVSYRATSGLEFRKMPDDFNEIPGLSDSTGDTWDFSAAYNFTRRLNIVVGYGYMGEVVKHTANRTFGVSIKYVF